MTKKTKKQKRDIFLPRVFMAEPYKREYTFAWTQAQWDHTCKKLKEQYPNEPYEDGIGKLQIGMSMRPLEDGVYVIGVNMLHDYGDDDIVNPIAILSHEISHAALSICQAIGYDPLWEQEPFCYLVQRMMSRGLWEMTYEWPTYAHFVALNKKHLKEQGRIEEIEHFTKKPQTT